MEFPKTFVLRKDILHKELVEGRPKEIDAERMTWLKDTVECFARKWSPKEEVWRALLKTFSDHDLGHLKHYDSPEGESFLAAMKRYFDHCRLQKL